MIKGIVLSFFCFLLFLSHIFIFHAFDIRRRFLAIAKFFFAGSISYCILYILIQEAQAKKTVGVFEWVTVLAFLNGAALHFILCYIYLYFVQIVDRTPTARIMIEIEGSQEKRLAIGQLKQLYSIDKKISDELEDMVILGRLRKEGDFYCLTSSGRKHMSIFRAVRNYLKLRRS